MCVVGPGGVGGYLAAVLAQGGLDVAVVARGAHGEAIARDGLRLIDPQRNDAAPARVTVHATLDAAPPARVVVLAVKQRDLASVTAATPRESIVLAVQNGVAHLDGPLTALPADCVLVGSVYIFSHVEAPGVIRVLGGPRLYRFGPLDPAQPALAHTARDIAGAWNAHGLLSAADDDGRRVCWEKLCLLAPLSGITALTARTVGEFRELPDMMQTFRAMCQEVRSVAVASGVAVDAGIDDLAAAGISRTDAEGRSSMYRDLAQGRESELDVLLGDVVRRADALGVPVPAMRTVYAATRLRYGVET